MAARMTRRDFEDWLGKQGPKAIVVDPYDIVPCTCRDRNCRGWRLIPATHGPGRRLVRDGDDRDSLDTS